MTFVVLVTWTAPINSSVTPPIVTSAWRSVGWFPEGIWEPGFQAFFGQIVWIWSFCYFPQEKEDRNVSCIEIQGLETEDVASRLKSLWAWKIRTIERFFRLLVWGFYFYFWCMWVWVWVRVCEWVQESTEEMEHPWARVTDSCESLDEGAGTQT